MNPRVFFKIKGVPVTQDAIPLIAVISGITCLGIYTGITRLRDPNYIRSSPAHAWKKN